MTGGAPRRGRRGRAAGVALCVAAVVCSVPSAVDALDLPAAPTVVPTVPHIAVPALPTVPRVELPALPPPLGSSAAPRAGTGSQPTRRPGAGTIGAPSRDRALRRSPPRSGAGPSSAPRAGTAAPTAGALAAGGTRSVPRAARPPTRPGRAHTTPAPRPPAPAGSRRPAAARPPESRPPTAGDLLDSIGKGLPLPLPVPDWSKPIIILLALIAIALALRSRLATARTRRLEAQGRSLQRDLDVMQHALVATVPSELGPLAVSVAYRPAEGPAAGGDFYDVFPLGGDRVGVILGDVAGHGRDALARAAQVRYSVRAYVEAGLEPRAALRLAGDVLSGEDSGAFATVAVGVYAGVDGTLTYATAGHPPPIVIGTGGHEPVTACASPPLGSGLPTGRRQTTVSLGPGARACFFSDGLVEARSGPELLGRDRLAEMLAGEGPPVDASALLAGVRDEAETVSDDMAACVIEPLGAAEAPPVRVEDLELHPGAGSGARAERFLRACEVPAHELPGLLALVARALADDGIALLRVGRAPADGVTVSVTRSRARATRRTSAAVLPPSAQPLPA